MVLEAVEANSLAEPSSDSHDETHLGLHIQPPRRAEDRFSVVRSHRQAEGATDRCTGDDDGARPPVVPDGQVLPVGRERLRARPEDQADVPSVLLARIEVDVVADCKGEMHLDHGRIVEVGPDDCFVLLAFEQRDEALTDFPPDRWPCSHESIERGPAEGVRGREPHGGGKPAEIEHVRSDASADPSPQIGRLSAFTEREHAVRKVLQTEARAGGHLDAALHGRNAIGRPISLAGMIPTDELLRGLASIVGEGAVLAGEQISEDLTHDEALVSEPVVPRAVVLPSSSGEVAAVVRFAAAGNVPITARGSASGLSGGCVATPGGIVVSFACMARVIEIDLENQVAVVQPGLTLHELDETLRPLGLCYPVYPGELTSSIGGNVATNAGGMRAVRYGVTRQNVLGLEMVLGTGEVLRSGGKFVKSSTGYDLTQIVIGSEGTLALVTEATLRLQPVFRHSVTVLAPFGSLRDVTAVIPVIVGSGLVPTILEYIDTLTMLSITRSESLDLPIPPEVADATSAYLVIVVEHRTPARIDEDVESLGDLLSDAGALDVFVLPGPAAASLLHARERAFYVAKAAGANEIIDVVVPRARIADFLESVGVLANEHGCFAVGCGHAGDGNIHLSVFQPDAGVREEFLVALFESGIALGGAISGEHGIGTAKREAYLALESPERLGLMRRIKEAFDPAGILNPDKVFGMPGALVTAPRTKEDSL